MGARYRLHRPHLLFRLIKHGFSLFFIIFVMMIYIYSNAVSRNDLHDTLREAIQDLHIPGAVMMVQTPDGERWTIRSGVKRVGTNIPIRTNLKFRVGSITKTFVASVILMLVEEGMLELDTEVHEILPGIISHEDPVTVRHLLQMRSSLGNFAADKHFLRDFRHTPRKVWVPAHLLSFRDGDRKEPGQSFEYNNSNYVLLGLIIEKLTGDTFENQVYERILKPLKLNSTTFPVTTPDMAEPYARGYDFNPLTGEVKNLSNKINPSWAWCSGNCVSTAPDILRWIMAYLNGFGIGKQLLAEQMDFRPGPYYGISYGLGVMNKFDAVGHNGNFAGIYTSIAFKFKGYYFVILTNGQSYGGSEDSTAESVFWQIVSRSSLFNYSD